MRQHLLRPSQCFVLIKKSDSPCPLQFWDGCSLRREHPERHSKSGNPRHARIHSPPEASSSFCSAQTSRQRPLYPTLRANPFPKVTDLFCRLPLSTLLYRPEATNIGDLMRLWVRPGVWINLSFGFSRAVENVLTPLKTRWFIHNLTLSSDNLIPEAKILQDCKFEGHTFKKMQVLAGLNKTTSHALGSNEKKTTVYNTIALQQSTSEMLAWSPFASFWALVEPTLQSSSPCCSHPPASKTHSTRHWSLSALWDFVPMTNIAFAKG